jgi:porin
MPLLIPEIPMMIPEIPMMIPEIPMMIPEIPMMIPEIPMMIPEIPMMIPELFFHGTVNAPATPAQLPVPFYNPPEVPHLFGDWAGVRPVLEDHGVYFQSDATAEFAGNVSGGTRQGATSANQVSLISDIDWQRLSGLTGFSTHAIVVNRSGRNLSQLFGDNVSPVQEIFGSGGSVAMHLVSAYAERSAYDGGLDIAAGWMNVENDFASSPIYCDFMNNALCGDPKALPGGDIGHSAFPDAVWGGRALVRPTPDTYFKAGLYEVNQFLYSRRDTSGTDFGTGRISGGYVPVQLGYTPQLSSDRLPGHYVIGFGYDTSRFASFSSALPPSAGVPATSTIGNSQFWLLLDQMLVRNGSGEQDGLIALAGYVHNNPDNSTYAVQYFAALVDRAFWSARPLDTAGLLFTYFGMSGTLAGVQAKQQALGLPLSNNATAPQGHEMILEATYNIHVYTGVDFRPNFQYVMNPNAQSNIKNAVVLGFKFNVSF